MTIFFHIVNIIITLAISIEKFRAWKRDTEAYIKFNHLKYLIRDMTVK